MFSTVLTRVICVIFHQVRCLVDYGEFETEDGNVILLKKNSQVSQCLDLFCVHNHDKFSSRFPFVCPISRTKTYSFYQAVRFQEGDFDAGKDHREKVNVK